MEKIIKLENLITYNDKINEKFESATTKIEANKQQLQDHLNNHPSGENSNEINVVNFGAVGDGVTDDTVAIQNAINSIVSGTIHFESDKTYIVSNSLNLKDGISLYGKNVTIKIKDSLNTFYLVKITNDNKITGFTFDGNVTSVTNTNDPFDCEGLVGNSVDSSNIFISQCKFINGYGRGVRIQRGNNCVITECHFENLGFDASSIISSGNNISITNNTYKDCKCVSTKVYASGSQTSSKEIIITDNIYNNCQAPTNSSNTFGIAIEVSNNVEEFIINDNEIKNVSDIAISLSGAKNGVCNSNNILYTGGGLNNGLGIEIVGCVDVIVSSNNIKYSSIRNIALSSSLRCKVSNNRLHLERKGGTYYEVHIEVSGGTNTVEGTNTSPCLNNTIDNNNFYGGFRGVLMSRGNAVDIVNNTLVNVRILYDNSTTSNLSENITIANNRCYDMDNNDHGVIALRNTNKFTIKNNTFNPARTISKNYQTSVFRIIGDTQNLTSRDNLAYNYNEFFYFSTNGVLTNMLTYNDIMTGTGNNVIILSTNLSDTNKCVNCKVYDNIINMEKRIYSLENKISVTGVTLSSQNMNLIPDGVAKLNAILEPSDATNRNVVWTSSNSEVATVSADGTITGEGVGSCVITVKTIDGSKTATCTINVINNTNYVEIPLLWTLDKNLSSTTGTPTTSVGNSITDFVDVDILSNYELRTTNNNLVSARVYFYDNAEGFIGRTEQIESVKSYLMIFPTNTSKVKIKIQHNGIYADATEILNDVDLLKLM